MLAFLCRRLVYTVSKLGRGVDPFELNLFQRASLGMHKQGLAECDHTLFNSGNSAFDQQKVILDLAIPDKATETRLVSYFLNLENKLTA
jgi:hypothetical protein